MSTYLLKGVDPATGKEVVVSTSNLSSLLTFANLSDVTITSVATGNYVRYNGTDWVNAAIAAGDLPIFGASGASHAPGAVPDPGATAGTTRYLREDGTWAVPAESSAADPYDIMMQYVGLPQQAEIIMITPIARAMTLPINLTGSQAVASVAATALTTLTVQQNDTAIGNIQFAAGSKVGTFTNFTTATTLAAGDVITIFNPNAADATLATIGVTLVATLS